MMDGDEIQHQIERSRELLAAKDYAQAVVSFQNAAKLARLEGRCPELAYALRHSALAALQCREFEIALADASEAERVYIDIEPSRGPNHANTLRLIALAKEELGRSLEARADWWAARDIYKALGIFAGVAECDDHLTSV